jgi:hypothetical protein
LVGKNIKLVKFTKIPLFGWKEYKIDQIYKFVIGPFLFWAFGEFLILGFWVLFDFGILIIN